MPSVYHHQITYEGDDFTIQEVIQSLRAQEQLLRLGAEALANASRGGRVVKTNIIIKDISTDTLLFDMLVELYGAYQKTFEVGISEGVEQMFGQEIPEEYRPLVTLFSLLVLYWLARFAYEKLRGTGKREGPPIHIEGENNVVVQMVSSQLGIPTGELEQAVGHAVPPKRRLNLLHSLADLIRPARKRNASIKVEGVEPVQISNAAITEMPTDAEVREIVKTTEMLERPNVRLEIRATDLDSRKRGWGGVILGEPDIKEERLPMDIYPTVATNGLQGEIRADVYVEAMRVDDGTFVPIKLHLIAVRPSAEP